jgi:hypothetical protein
MHSPRTGALAALAAASLGVVAALLLHYRSPDPSVDVSRGGEDAFATGLFPRELPPGGAPLRWTRERGLVRFRHLPRGTATLEVDVRGHRGPVTVAADGVIVGVLPPGAAAAGFELGPSDRRSRDIELRTTTFQAGDGRDLGTQLRRVTLRPGPRGSPPAALLAMLAALSAAGFLAAAAAGFATVPALALAAALVVSSALALWPLGLVRSPYALNATLLTVVGCGWAALVARRVERRWRGVGRAAFAGLVLAVLVQGLAATSPLMVVSDAVFHANNLLRVVAGNLWITSRTQHSPPFQFPYGVSFYVLLAPLFRLGVDAVWLVRVGAAVAGLAGSAALVWMLAPQGAARAGLAVGLLQLLPMTFDLYSFGNLSNVFAQALTVVFFAWWTAGGPGGWPLGALLVAAAAMGHLSSFVVLAVLPAALLVAWRGERPRARWRVLSVAVGLALAALYYFQFLPLATAQLPRLAEGSTASAGGNALTAPLFAVVRQWGLPVTVLALAGLPRPGRGPFDRDLSAYWTAGAILAVVAVVSPLEVRYAYALGPPLAAAAAAGAVRGWSYGMAGRLGVLALCLAQAVLASRNLVESVLWRYRS